MQAIQIPAFTPDPSTLKPTGVPKPQPKQNEYLIRVTHCSPQHADILHAQGKHQNTHPKKGHVHPPFILGYDFAGIVTQVPSTPPSKSRETAPVLKQGDRVFGAGIGAFAEYIAVAPSQIRKIPDSVDSATACAASGQAVSYAAVMNVAKIRSGDTVLVSGASGGLGSACCAVAKALGAKVIALAGDEGKAASMRKDMDVDCVLVTDDEGRWVEGVFQWTGGKGVDVVLDNTGMVNQAIRCVAYAGTIVILGFAARKGMMEEVKMNRLLLKSITLIGYRFGESGRRFPETLEEIWDGYLRMLAEGKLKPVLYSERYDGLADLGRALGDLASRKVYGRAVVPVTPAINQAKL